MFIMRIIFLILFLFLSQSAGYVFADDTAVDNSNWGIQSHSQSESGYGKPGSQSEDAWDAQQDDTIYNNYGSEESPAFLNRENINPNESDYGYGSTDGME